MVGHLEDLGEAAVLEQRVPGLRAVDDRRRRDQVALALEELGELPGELGRVEPPGGGDAAEERHHPEILERAAGDERQAVVERAAPADADGHRGAHRGIDEAAGGGGDHLDRVDPGGADRCGDDAADVVAGLHRLLDAGQLGERGGDGDADLVAPPCVGDQPHHRHPVQPEHGGDLVLGVALDEVEPHRPRPQPVDLGRLRSLGEQLLGRRDFLHAHTSHVRSACRPAARLRPPAAATGSTASCCAPGSRRLRSGSPHAGYAQYRAKDEAPSRPAPQARAARG